MAIPKTNEPLSSNGLPLPAGDAKVLKNPGSMPPKLNEIDPSKLTITMSNNLKPMPAVEDLVFGQTMTDHMLIMHYEPENGWSAPEIKPYGPLSIDPASSCLQYCPNVFEGMKAYLGADGKPRLFRPELNMKRLEGSAARMALPPFDSTALLVLIKRLVQLESRWIPKPKGSSLYIRPTLIGTRAALGVTASTHATLFVILSPTGPYFKSSTTKGISLLAVGEHVRSWPGGHGGFKLGLNYAPGFSPQRMAIEKGYQQVLWLIGENITEAGAMNFFIVVKRDDGGLDIITPPLDGTILPGITRASVLSLLAAHPTSTSLPELSNALKLHLHERPISMPELYAYSASGRLLEAFCAGTAVVVTAVARIGWSGKGGEEGLGDVVLPEYRDKRGGGEPRPMGPVASALYERLVDVQHGRVEWQGWSLLCE